MQEERIMGGEERGKKKDGTHGPEEFIGIYKIS